MKLLTLLIVLGLSTPSFAEVVKENITASRDWKAVVLSEHMTSKKEACMASVESSDKKARLEVYAEKSKHGNFIEPTVQIVLKGMSPVLAGNLLPNRSTKSYAMSMTPQPIGKPQVLLARYDERARLVNDIKRKSTLRLTLYNKSGKSMGRLSFSLRGSSKVVGALFNECGLEITD